MGCYNEEAIITPSSSPFVDNAMTLEKCISHCTSINKLYAAIKGGKNCYCEDGYLSHKLEDSPCKCDNDCPGDSKQICGGVKSLSAYEILCKI